MISDQQKSAIKAMSQNVEQQLEKQFPEWDFICTITSRPKPVESQTYRARGGVTVPLKTRQAPANTK